MKAYRLASDPDGLGPCLVADDKGNVLYREDVFRDDHPTKEELVWWCQAYGIGGLLLEFFERLATIAPEDQKRNSQPESRSQ